MNRRVRFYASLGWVNDTREETVDMVEIGYEDWDEMSDTEQGKACEEFYEDWLAGVLDSGWHEADQ